MIPGPEDVTDDCVTVSVKWPGISLTPIMSYNIMLTIDISVAKTENDVLFLSSIARTFAASHDLSEPYHTCSCEVAIAQ